MEGIHRQLLADTTNGDVVGPFFGFMGAAAALVFACKLGNGNEFGKQSAHMSARSALITPSLC